MYRFAKWFERQLLLNSDHVISLTRAGVREMVSLPYLKSHPTRFTVIPTCADLMKFRKLDVQRSDFIVGYVGSMGTWYEFDAVVKCFASLQQRRPDVRFLVLNRSDHEYARERLVSGGISLEAVDLVSVRHYDVPLLMSRMHAGIFFIKPLFSKRASAPTRLAEFLGCGVPCLSNYGVGDMAELLEGERVGVAVSDFSSQSLEEGVDRLLSLIVESDIALRCRRVAERNFSLEEGVLRYEEVYKSLAKAS